jgi:hypothetical protein
MRGLVLFGLRIVRARGAPQGEDWGQSPPGAREYKTLWLGLWILPWTSGEKPWKVLFLSCLARRARLRTLAAADSAA